MNYLDKHKRTRMSAIAFLITTVLLFPGFFVVAHIEHEYIGKDCSICVELRKCATTIRLITEATGAGATVTFAYIITQKPLSSHQIGLYLCPAFLVSLKIRLDSQNFPSMGLFSIHITAIFWDGVLCASGYTV